MKVKKILRVASNRARMYGRSWYFDRASMENTTVLLSSGRSGSTWLGAMLQSLPSTRTIFEPFQPRKGIPSLRDHRYTYFDPETECPAVSEVLENTIIGRVKTSWTDQFNSIYRIVYRRRLLKAVRMNLMYPWVSTRFPACKYIFLIRHPAAVILSQLRDRWELSPGRLLDQVGIRRKLGIDRGVGDLFKKDDFMNNLLFWAIENGIALNYARRAGALIVTYEELCVSPVEQLSKIERHIDVVFPPSVYHQLERTSWSSRRGVGKQSIETKIAKWQESTNASQLKGIKDVQHICGFGDLYGDDAMPDSSLLN